MSALTKDEQAVSDLLGQLHVKSQWKDNGC